MPTALYHFTCAHSAPRIQRSGELRPHQHPLLGTSLVWLTDLAVPDRHALGLTSNWITCDRTAVRISVPAHAGGLVPWRKWAYWHRVPPPLLDALEDGARYDRWWVCDVPLRVTAITTSTYGTGGAS